jgi:hypothetical protein
VSVSGLPLFCAVLESAAGGSLTWEVKGMPSRISNLKTGGPSLLFPGGIDLSIHLAAKLKWPSQVAEM